MFKHCMDNVRSLLAISRECKGTGLSVLVWETPEYLAPWVNRGKYWSPTKIDIGSVIYFVLK